MDYYINNKLSSNSAFTDYYPYTGKLIINIIVYLLDNPLVPERTINLVVHLLAIPLTLERLLLI
jgi:hypothetical protein